MSLFFLFKIQEAARNTQVVNTSTKCTPHNPDSVFASTDRKPALGPSFTFLTDTTLWLAKRGSAEDGSATHVAEVFRSRLVVSLH